jgi:hypothetical protein
MGLNEIEIICTCLLIIIIFLQGKGQFKAELENKKVREVYLIFSPKSHFIRQKL